MRTTDQAMHTLGYAGLIPFVAPAMALALGIEHGLLSLSMVNVYAFGIISFLCGSWWGAALQRQQRAGLILSNALFLVAFFVFCFAIDWWPLAACLLLACLFVIERTGVAMPFTSRAYSSMRAVLTGIAAVSMLVVHLAR